MNKKNFVPILFSVITALLLIVVVVCVVLSAVYHAKAPDTPAPPDQRQMTPTVSETGTPSEHSTPPTGKETPSQPAEPIKKSVLQQTEDAGGEYIDQLIFLGDSTTYGMINAGVLKDKQDTHQIWYGPGGTLTLPAATSHLLNDGSLQTGKTLAEMAKEKQPKIIVVTLGVGVSYSLDEDKFKTAYEAVLDQILASSPSTQIICNSIYPVCAVLSDNYPNINNEDIRKANGWILDITEKRCEEGQKVFYLDSYSVLAGKDGYLPVNYTNGDGLHLSMAAFKAILKNLRTHALTTAD